MRRREEPKGVSEVFMRCLWGVEKCD